MSKKLIYLVSFVLVLGLVSNANASADLVDGDTLNGNFNNLISPSTVDAQPFSNTVAWENIGTGTQETQCTRANVNFDGSRNAVLSGGDAKDFALDTGHTISVGEYFDISYVWRDASNWDDGSDQVRVRLFVTDDNTINGTRTDLVEDFSELSTQNSTYEAVDHDAIYVAVPADSGKTLFVVIDTTASSNEFARLDNFTLEVGTTYTASVPNPKNNAVDVLIDADLSWTPGALAATHDVYFGESFEDVNTATTDSAVYQGRQSETAYALDHLDLGQTYYWRVDEVNAPPDNTIFKGNVWSFTTEPVGYPIAGENITVTASSSNNANEGPENTINDSGLDDNDLHSEENKDMWLSSMIGQQPTWIQYEFERVYKLNQMLVWNHNSSLELAIGFGIKEATIEYSADGASWTTLGTHEFARGSGAAGYAANTTVDLSGVVAKYVKITANSNWGGFMPQFGLSEVRFFYIPVLAREPDPASGTTDMDVDNVTLSWRAGREAASHEVQLSDSNQAVIDGTALVATVSETSYDTGELQLNQSYYWKVNEVNETETHATWEGDVWNLATREFMVVDDFEDYNNSSPDRVFQTWIDGIGYSADEFFPVDNPGNGSGAALGHDIWSYDSPHYDGDIMETAIVHGGAQSAPLYYDNSIAPFTSEIVRTFDVAQDWAKHGIKTLTLYFYGDPNNVAQQMYVKLNGVKVIYDGEAANITRIPWQAWNIDLADFAGVDPAPVAGVGVDLSNVTELSIGLESIGAVGGSGVVYFDDIRLYPYSREFVTPVEPDIANLVAHYEFEGTANDSSDNGLHGTAVGEPVFVAGKIGQAISLDGVDDYVNITGYKGILGPNAVTVTAWINTISTETGAIVGWGPNVDGQRFGFRINADRLRLEHQGGNVQGDTGVNDGGWHHVAVTVQESATISYPEVVLYLNGIDDTRPSTDPDAFALIAGEDVRIGSRPSNDDRYFTGQIDDVRIYDSALSQEEIAWLAGRTKPFDKPF